MAINKGRKIDDIRRDLYTALGRGGISVTPSGVSTAVNSVEEFAKQRSRNFAALAKGRTTSIDSSFQFGSKTTRGPVSREVIENLVGGSEEFLSA